MADFMKRLAARWSEPSPLNADELITGAFTWLGILTAAFGGAFLFYLWLMFGVRGDIANINQNVAVQGKVVSEIERTVDRIEDKLDRQPQPTPDVKPKDARQ